MRTTLTLTDDVAALLARVRNASGRGLKEAINEGLRRGLIDLLQERSPSRRTFETKAVSLRPSVTDVDSIAEVLAVNEDERFR